MDSKKAETTKGEALAVYHSATFWRVERPSTLVVACSDGRLQNSLDSFLRKDLLIHDYDRLFIPGGSGALVPGGYEYIRADRCRRDLFFLLNAHGTDDLILIAHGARADGPPEATCAHYRRVMQYAPLSDIEKQQTADIQEFCTTAHAELSKIHVRAFRAEVGDDMSVYYRQIL